MNSTPIQFKQFYESIHKNSNKTDLLEKIYLNNPKQEVFNYKLNVKLTNENLTDENKEIIIKKIIGTKGYYFYKTTDAFQLYYIWYNKEENTIDFWGDNINKCVNASNFIKKRIENFNNNYIENYTQTNYTEYLDN